MSTAPEYTFTLLIPSYAGGRRISPDCIPFTTAHPGPDWQFNEGESRWVLEGVPLLDRDVGLYPLDQLTAVLDLLDLALRHARGTVNIGGSIVNLSTTPIDRHRALFAYDVPARRVAPRIKNQAEHREINANIRKAGESVRDAVHEIMIYLDTLAAPPRPGAPAHPDYSRGSLGESILHRVSRLDTALAPRPDLGRRHGSK